MPTSAAISAIRKLINYGAKVQLFLAFNVTVQTLGFFSDAWLILARFSFDDCVFLKKQ